MSVGPLPAAQSGIQAESILAAKESFSIFKAPVWFILALAYSLGFCPSSKQVRLLGGVLNNVLPTE
jgi:hypothetical protein